MTLQGVPERTHIDDRFSGIIDDDQREAILNSPLPLVVVSLEQAVSTALPEDVRRRVAENCVGLATSARYIPPAVKDYTERVVGLPRQSPKPWNGVNPNYIGQLDQVYLAIACGTIEAINNSPELDFGQRQKFVAALQASTQEKLKGNPNKPLVEACLRVFADKALRKIG